MHKDADDSFVKQRFGVNQVAREVRQCRRAKGMGHSEHEEAIVIVHLRSKLPPPLIFVLQSVFWSVIRKYCVQIIK